MYPVRLAPHSTYGPSVLLDFSCQTQLSRCVVFGRNSEEKIPEGISAGDGHGCRRGTRSTSSPQASSNRYLQPIPGPLVSRRVQGEAVQNGASDYCGDQAEAAAAGVSSSRTPDTRLAAGSAASRRSGSGKRKRRKFDPDKLVIIPHSIQLYNSARKCQRQDMLIPERQPQVAAGDVGQAAGDAHAQARLQEGDGLRKAAAQAGSPEAGEACAPAVDGGWQHADQDQGAEVPALNADCRDSTLPSDDGSQRPRQLANYIRAVSAGAAPSAISGTSSVDAGRSEVSRGSGDGGGDDRARERQPSRSPAEAPAGGSADHGLDGDERGRSNAPNDYALHNSVALRMCGVQDSLVTAEGVWRRATNKVLVISDGPSDGHWVHPNEGGGGGEGEIIRKLRAEAVANRAQIHQLGNSNRDSMKAAQKEIDAAVGELKSRNQKEVERIEAKERDQKKSFVAQQAEHSKKQQESEFKFCKVDAELARALLKLDLKKRNHIS